MLSINGAVIIIYFLKADDIEIRSRWLNVELDLQISVMHITWGEKKALSQSVMKLSRLQAILVSVTWWPWK